ncbi:hypothetical protein [Botrimarina mediterranea]|uniref:hypothetical protein n=1 Tax=Botrimarina mediterranea TaxID=2528022 RepID=UPI0011885D08|nr:hypothetical protein K2D_16400 [Planctomycetes bacterium K2D]
MLSEFDELVARRKQLKAWWSLRNKQTYNGGGHELRVDTARPTLVSLCGQAYAGARNYHDAPEFFVVALAQEMQANACRLAKVAYENEMARLDASIESHRESVLAELAKD